LLSDFGCCHGIARRVKSKIVVAALLGALLPANATGFRTGLPVKKIPVKRQNPGNSPI
jgi:hypothetical protein